MATTAGWLFHQTEVPHGEWFVSEVTASVELLDRAVAGRQSTFAPDERAVGIAMFDGDFGYLVLAIGDAIMRCVVNRDLAMGTGEGLEAIRLAGAQMGTSSFFAWRGRSGSLSATEIQAEIDAAIGERDLESALASVLELLGIKEIALSVEGEPFLTVGASNGTRSAQGRSDWMGPRYTLRSSGAEPVRVEIVDGVTGQVIAAYADIGDAMAEAARLNGGPYLGSRDPLA